VFECAGHYRKEYAEAEVERLPCDDGQELGQQLESASSHHLLRDDRHNAPAQLRDGVCRELRGINGASG
jgi:hypothetical protein